MGILLQFLLGLFVLKTTFGKNLFEAIAKLVGDFLHLGKEYGANFLWFGANKYENFIVNVLPAIIFFAAFIQMVYYLGAMQWVIVKFAWAMMRIMDTSGCESVVAAASPFVGQGESALLVRPFLEFMTESELHTVMASGFSTIAGSVLSAFLAMGIDGTSLISSCIMSVPCSLALSKMRIPETEQSMTKGDVSIPEGSDTEKEANVLHAVANGAAAGVHLAGLIVGSLLAIVSLYHFCNIVFSEFLGYVITSEKPISIDFVLGYVFSPLAWLLGVPTNECLRVGSMLGKKMVLNEFVAFDDLSKLIKANDISLRGARIATYALCGFANIASVGIQIGCLGAMAPTRRGDIARIAFPAMLVGAMCTFCSAAIAGILL
jgi:CNT family concentrative nucleoside transporter